MADDDAVHLIKPTEALRDDFLAYLDERVQAGEDLDTEIVKRIGRDFHAYLRFCRNQAAGRDLKPGRVPQQSYWLVRGERIVATARLRRGLTEWTEQRFGNIGYDVRPSERGKGYGTLVLKLMKEKARQSGMDRVLLTCNKSNVPSARIIEKNGGVLRDEIIQPDTKKPLLRWWIDLTDSDGEAE